MRADSLYKFDGAGLMRITGTIICTFAHRLIED